MMKTSKRTIVRVFGFVFALALFVGQAHATSLAPGGTVVPTGTVALSGPNSICGANVTCSAAATTGTVNFSGINAQSQVRYTGSLTQNVYLNTTFDGVTGTSFLWTVTNNAGSLDSISRISMTSFSGFLTDVGYISGSGDVPLSADRNASPGSTVGFFNWNVLFGGITPGTTTVAFLIQTNANSFTVGSTSTINGAIANIGTFAPINASTVPEPGSLILLGSAFAGMGLASRRRRKSS